MPKTMPEKSHEQLVKENGELKTALDAAIRALTPFEEPGRFFGSPLYVSLLCVMGGDADQECWDVINEYIDAERRREEAGIPVQFIEVNKLHVKIGKKLDSYMLPDDVVENRAIHVVIETLRDTPQSHLQMMTTRQLKLMVDQSMHVAELSAAIKLLEREDVDILKQVWIYTDPNTEEEFHLDDNERKQILESGLFIHPNEGVTVPNFREHLSVYHALNTDNQEFMSWKAEYEPAAMKL